MSTFVVECDAETWGRAGFASMGERATLAYLEKLFGHRLVSNKSVWRNFPNLRNRRWHVGNTVLIGDALRTAHFSIGSGTRPPWRTPLRSPRRSITPTLSQTLRLRAGPLSRSSVRRRMPAARGTTPFQGT